MKNKKPKKTDDWEKEFDKFVNNYMATEEHLFHCVGYSEGQECCLDKEKPRKKIKQFIKTLLQEKKKEMKIEIQYWKDLWVEEKQLKKPKK
jgi:hypothetical protein